MQKAETVDDKKKAVSRKRVENRSIENTYSSRKQIGKERKKKD